MIAPRVMLLARSDWLAITCSILAIVIAIVTGWIFRVREQHKRLRGKHVWVVGASRGIGRATAIQLARHGAIVSISARDTDRLNQVHDALGANGGAVVRLDVTSDMETLTQGVRQVEAEKALDVVILNAGINQQNRAFLALDAHTIDMLLDTNLRGVLRLAMLTVPRVRQTGGVLCVISSLAAYRGVPGASVYGATKAAVSTFCQSLAVELYDDDADVVCVHPGFVDTTAIRSLPHAKPLQMSEEGAAHCVVDAVARRKSQYGFPWLMQHVVMTVSVLMPICFYNWILKRMA